MKSYLARQAIYKNKEIVGYELLYRTSSENFFPIGTTDDEATIRIICNAFFDNYYQLISNDKKMWINFNENLLNLKLITLLPKDKLVIEILESVEPSKNLLEKIKVLNKIGYTIALDDFIFNDDWSEIIPFISYIKFDLIQNNIQEIEESILTIKKINNDIKYLGEKIEDKNDIISMKKLGVDHFQGFYLSKPEIIKINHKNQKIIDLYTDTKKENYNNIGNVINYLT